MPRKLDCNAGRTSHTITAKVNHTEKMVIRDFAAAQGVSVSKLVRDAVLDAVILTLLQNGAEGDAAGN